MDVRRPACGGGGGLAEVSQGKDDGIQNEDGIQNGGTGDEKCMWMGENIRVENQQDLVTIGNR